MPFAPGRRSTGFALLAAFGAACSPTLNWRELRLAAPGVIALLPCKPSTVSRSVQLAGRDVQLTLHACSAGGQTWALALADMADPGRTAAALDELKRSAAGNLGTSPGEELPLKVNGATPNAASARVMLAGRLPDGKAVVGQVAVFARGTWVVQATALGETLPADAAETFFGSIRADA